MQTSPIRVAVSRSWLKVQLCELHGRLDINQSYLTEVHREFVFLLETDLAAGLSVCTPDLVRLAVDTIDAPYMVVTST